ncbi:hypothetical protein F2Q69_00049956 [Brassica cretica]|uniref:Uncharacterized protein n=1 Tax=Brassica cretica TaxID=69181 RepID=A0A8S9PZ86_BRACR|nr:hypothetical protein F2Q69_00049956 [Brassica cretica]
MRLRVWKVKKSCVLSITMSGYQPRNNQQGSYQPQQNPPPGFNNKGHHSSQQQANLSTSTPQVSSTDALLKQILESQTRSEKHVGYELKNLHSKIDGSYNELNNKFRTLENQFAAMNTQQNRQQGPGARMKGCSIWERRHHSDSPRSLVFVAFQNAKNRPGATSSERQGQVAREERPGSDVFGATRPSRSRIKRPWSDLSQRHPQVAPGRFR